MAGAAAPFILSLFDYSGEWSRPYREAGYDVLQVDIKHGHDIFDLDLTSMPRPRGILAAPPCTDFAVSGARWWKDKDADGRTEASIRLMWQTIDTIKALDPEWWALENPVGRLNQLVPELAPFGPWYWQPWWFGDAYTKRTGLWGTFNRELPRSEVTPVPTMESPIMKQGGRRGRPDEELGRAIRSTTPAGFARAFFAANP